MGVFGTNCSKDFLLVLNTVSPVIKLFKKVVFGFLHQKNIVVEVQHSHVTWRSLSTTAMDSCSSNDYRLCSWTFVLCRLYFLKQLFKESYKHLEGVVGAQSPSVSVVLNAFKEEHVISDNGDSRVASTLATLMQFGLVQVLEKPSNCFWTKKEPSLEEDLKRPDKCHLKIKNGHRTVGVKT